jgi:hypothetical protein
MSTDNITAYFFVGDSKFYVSEDVAREKPGVAAARLVSGAERGAPPRRVRLEVRPDGSILISTMSAAPPPVADDLGWDRLLARADIHAAISDGLEDLDAGRIAPLDLAALETS